jgi:DNA sulfur modification protein DndC
MELVINFSGGKDSLAMLASLCEHYPQRPQHVVFADTGWEHDDAEEWSRALVARFGLPLHVVRNANQDFFQLVRQRGKFPAPAHRQCTSDLKRAPIQTWLRRNVADPLVINCLGLRAEESPARARKARLARDRTQSNSKRTVWTWLPIHDWTEQQVKAYLAERHIPLHPVYQYLSRFSCQVCMYMTKRDLLAVKAPNPVAFQRIADVEREIGCTMQPGQSIGGRIAEIHQPANTEWQVPVLHDAPPRA